jgi:hypothetical protein
MDGLNIFSELMCVLCPGEMGQQSNVTMNTQELEVGHGRVDRKFQPGHEIWWNGREPATFLVSLGRLCKG